MGMKDEIIYEKLMFACFNGFVVILFQQCSAR